LSEKFARIKLLLENPAGGQLARLEKLEALALGIEGKRTLWRTLLAIAEEKPALRKVDFARLDQRADDQRKRVESLRIELRLPPLRLQNLVAESLPVGMRGLKE
jgi:hypothetical protein